MAVGWLDLSRYADTHGYHLDAGREMWKWREWVIDAFNRNQHFDEFVLWQLAGDLLPNATTEQKLATGFCRNNMINFEGGAIADEYLAAYIKDRTSTFATAFLGLTLACCECHDHKFDPFTQREYYQLSPISTGCRRRDWMAGKEMPRLCSRCPRLSKPRNWRHCGRRF